MSSTTSGARRHAPLEVGRAIVFEDVAAPDDLAARRVQTSQFAERAERVDAAVVIGRRRARSVAAHRLHELAFPHIGPQFAAGLDVVRGHDLFAAPLLDGEGAAAGHDERGVAEADRLLPELRQSASGPVGANDFGASAVARGSAEVGPDRRRHAWPRRLRCTDRFAGWRYRRGLGCRRGLRGSAVVRSGSWRRCLPLPCTIGFERIVVRRARNESGEHAAAIQRDAKPGDIERARDDHQNSEDRDDHDRLSQHSRSIPPPTE